MGLITKHFSFTKYACFRINRKRISLAHKWNWTVWRFITKYWPAFIERGKIFCLILVEFDFAFLRRSTTFLLLTSVGRFLWRFSCIRGAFNKFRDFFLYGHLKLSWTLENSLCYCYTSYEMTDQFFNDFRFKWTATTAIGIHPDKSWLSQLVNFKNVIWAWGHFRRTICNKILFWTWKKWCHRNVWNASDCFSTILHESSINFLVA